MHDIPVQQTSMDRGGMYFIKEDFLPHLREMDAKIRSEFDKDHGEDVVKASGLISHDLFWIHS